jgi:hypothetical protein
VTAEGTTTITYWSQDAHGNTESPKSATVQIDTSAPTQPGTPEWSQLANGSVDLYWAGSTDALSGVDHYVVLDGSTEVTQTTGREITLQVDTNSPHHFAVVAVDGVGNRSVTSGSLMIDQQSQVAIIVPSKLASGYNKSVTITVKLMNSDSVYLSKRSIALEENVNGSWVKVADMASTKIRGTYTAKVARTSRSVFRAHFLGDPTYGATASSDIVLVPQALLPTPTVPSRVKPGVTFTISGTLLPAHTGTAYVTVEIQCKPIGGAWTAVSATQVAVAPGATAYALSTSLPKGSYRLRASHADSTHAYTVTVFRALIAK